jgi:hypothetical protein
MLPSQFHFSLAAMHRITAGYLFVSGTIGLFWPLFRLGPDHPEFQAHTAAFKAGAYVREASISIAYLVAGLALWWDHAWGRTLALVFLVIGTFYGANAFAWGFSMGTPTRRVRLFSRIIVGLWNGLWFYLIYRFAM